MVNTTFILYRREYNMYDKRENGRCYTTFHKTKNDMLKEIEESERLEWWFNNEEIDEDIAIKYKIPIDDPIEILYKTFDEFWDFYTNIIGTRPVYYEWEESGAIIFNL